MGSGVVAVGVDGDAGLAMAGASGASLASGGNGVPWRGATVVMTNEL